MVSRCGSLGQVSEIEVSVQAEPADLESWLAQDVAQSPFTLLGTHEQIADQLRRQAATLSITSYVVREPAVPAMERVLALLRA